MDRFLRLHIPGRARRMWSRLVVHRPLSACPGGLVYRASGLYKHRCRKHEQGSGIRQRAMARPAGGRPPNTKRLERLPVSINININIRIPSGRREFCPGGEAGTINNGLPEEPILPGGIPAWLSRPRTGRLSGGWCPTRGRLNKAAWPGPNWNQYYINGTLEGSGCLSR